MQQLEQMIHDLERFIQLDQLIADMKPECAGLRADAAEAEAEMHRREADLSPYEHPGFLRKFRHGFAEQREKLHQRYQASVVHYENICRELSLKQESLRAMEAEYEALRPVRDGYGKARSAYLASPQGDPEKLKTLEAHMACIAANLTAGRIIFALQEARVWMQTDVPQSMAASGQNRKQEFLSIAESQVKILMNCIACLPENAVTIGHYLRSPGDYITGAASPYLQLDNLNLAIAQVGALRDQLKVYL